jgi:hypothetical protein
MTFGLRDHRREDIAHARVMPLGIDRAQLVVHLVRVPTCGLLQTRDAKLDEISGHPRPNVGYLLQPS